MPYKFSRMACGIVFLVTPAAMSQQVGAAELSKLPATAVHSNSPKAKASSQVPAQAASTASRPSGARLTEDKFRDWSLQCIVNASATPPCQIIYRLMSSDHKQVALVLSLALYPKNSPRLQMALPLGFSIPRGVHIAFGQDYSLTAQISRCTIQGCLIEGEGQAKMIDAMLKAKGGTASVYNMQGSEIRLPISLDGFSAAYEVLRKKDG